MQIDRRLTDLPPEVHGGAVAIGNFDGVHRGHAALIERLVERAQELGGPAIVLTFDPHPVRLLRPDRCPPPLTWTERKADLLNRLGVDRLIAYPTDNALLRLSAKQFFDLIVCDTLKARALVEGPNFFFGHNREGNVELLQEFADSASMTLDVVAPTTSDSEMISSSRIRELIGGQGSVGEARQMLTAPYRVRGIVTHGAGRGTGLGVPTANLEGIDTLVPASGVYAARAWARVDATTSLPWPAAVNIGPNPTFDDNRLKVEAHLLGCEETLYGRPVELDFLERLRDVHRFDSSELLIEQIKKDSEATLRIYKQLPPL